MRAIANPIPIPPGMRSLEQNHDDQVSQLRLLPMNSKSRGPLIIRIRQVEDAIDARSPL